MRRSNPRKGKCMTDNSSDIAIPVGTFAFHSPIQNYALHFRNGTEVVGKMDFNGPQMKFEGNADESVDAFVRAFGHWFSERLKKEREAEREACAKLCDDVNQKAYDEPDDWSPWEAADACANAIRARGNDDA